MMQKIIGICCISFILSCTNTSDEKKPGDNTSISIMKNNQLTAEEQKEGWTLLFDGSTMKGWHKYGNKPLGTAWKIMDGCITLDTSIKENWQIKDGGDIVSDDEFEQYHLKLEWKIAKDGNSGIIFNVNEDTTKYKHPWMTGPEQQILDNAGHPDGKIIKHRAGDLYDLIKVSKETVKAPGEWNLAEIKLQNGKLDFYLNGENTVSTMLWDEAWRKLVAGSKFKEFPGFGTYKKGRIALQDHGNAVWFRNIKIKKL